MEVLIYDGSVTDSSLKGRNGEQCTECLIMALNMYLELLNEYLLKSFEMQLFYPAELPEYFFVLHMNYEMFTINRSHLVNRMLGKEVLPFCNFESLSQSHEKFLALRRAMTFAQKLKLDQLEFFRGMQEVAQGMLALTSALLKQGVIRDPWAQWDSNARTQGARAKNYLKRYGLLRAVQFPKFKGYDNFLEETSKFRDQAVDTVLDESRQHFVTGNKILQSLVNTPEDQRNGHYLKNQELQDIMKVSVSNSLIASQVKMTPEEDRKKMLCTIDYDNSLWYLAKLQVTVRK